MPTVRALVETRVKHIQDNGWWAKSCRKTCTYSDQQREADEVYYDAEDEVEEDLPDAFSEGGPEDFDDSFDSYISERFYDSDSDELEFLDCEEGDFV